MRAIPEICHSASSRLTPGLTLSSMTGVGVLVAVGVLVGVAVAVGVTVAVWVAVGVGVSVGVWVGVGGSSPGLTATASDMTKVLSLNSIQTLT